MSDGPERIEVPDLVIDVGQVKGFQPGKHGTWDIRMTANTPNEFWVPTDPELLALIGGRALAQRMTFAEDGDRWIGHWLDRVVNKCQTPEHIQDVCLWNRDVWAKYRRRGS